MLGASALLFLTALGIAGVKSSHDLETARQRKLSLQARIHSTEAEIDRLRNRIDRLRSDPGLLERLAREDLGMVRPGDVVVELPLEASTEKPSLPVPALPLPPPLPPLAPAQPVVEGAQGGTVTVASPAPPPTPAATPAATQTTPAASPAAAPSAPPAAAPPSSESL